MGLASPDQFPRVIIVFWLSIALLYYPAFLITRNWEWASFLLNIFVFGFYFSQFYFKVIGSIVIISFIVWQIYYRLRGFKIKINQFSALLNGIAVLAIFLSLYLTIRNFAQVPWSGYLGYIRSVNAARNYSVADISIPQTKPDIYYIVLDGYLRSDMLKELFEYDNTQFTSFLEGNGFVIPTDIHSNYAKTALSIPSTLNMDYVHSFSPGLENSYSWWLMSPFIDHSRLRSVLEAQGYKTISLSTDWTLTDNVTTDLYFSPYAIMLTDFERYFFGDTPLRYLMPSIKQIASVPTYDTHRRIMLHSFESLKTIPELLGPKFIFAHIIAPHPPFVFSSTGEPIDVPGPFTFADANDFHGSLDKYQAGYVEQVQYVNAQMKQVVDSILKKSKSPPIIIIQADHGSGLLTDFSSAENTCIKERFSPFGAYFLPGLDQSVIPRDITPVNLFRIVLNQYFQTNLPLLENRQYFYKDTVYIYRLVDVTSRVDDGCSFHQ
jgi:hypothetical protein